MDFYTVPEPCGCLVFYLHNNSDDLPIIHKYIKTCQIHNNVDRRIEPITDGLLSKLWTITKTKIEQHNNSIITLEHQLKLLAVHS